MGISYYFLEAKFSLKAGKYKILTGRCGLFLLFKMTGIRFYIRTLFPSEKTSFRRKSPRVS